MTSAHILCLTTSWAPLLPQTGEQRVGDKGNVCHTRQGVQGRASAIPLCTFPASSAVEGPKPGARLQTQKD